MPKWRRVRDKILQEMEKGLETSYNYIGRQVTSIGSGARDFAPAPSHTTGRAVFSHPAVGTFRVLPSQSCRHVTPEYFDGLGASSVGPAVCQCQDGNRNCCVLLLHSITRPHVQRLGWLRLFLRPFAPPGFHRASSLLWPLLTSVPLSRDRSLWVGIDSVGARRRALPDAFG